jgi:phage terminase large subunit-like protein
MPSRVAKARKGGAAVLETPSPWWGMGEAPHVRWPGVTLEIPCVWNQTQKRWETSDGWFWFDAESADFAEQFFPTCLQHHIGNDWNGKPFELLPYQSVIVRALFGWKRHDGLRRFRKVFLAVPKGNGKSPFGAGLGLFGAFFDGEAGAEAYAVAADRKQAGIVFDSAKVMVERNTRWDGLFQVFRDSIKQAGGTECFQVLSSDASTKHGFRPHFIIFDEFHAQPNRDLFDTLYRGMGKRRQPVLVMITTAGDDDESICFEEWDFARRVRDGGIDAPEYLPMIFEATPADDWSIEETWRRVNPGYGITIRADYFEVESRAAQAEPRKRNSFLQLHLNRWVNQATAWIPVEWWDACYQSFTDEDVKGLTCAAGLDLAQKWDLAAFVVAFRKMIGEASVVEVLDKDEVKGDSVKKVVTLNYEISLVPFFWIPEETMRQHEKIDGVPYSQWARDGLITPTEGAIIDYTRIYSDITTKILPRFPLLKQGLIGYDPAFATDIATQLRDKAGLKVHEVLQNYTHLSESGQVFEAMVKAKRARHAGHRILRNHVENMAVKRDDAGRIRPVKPKKNTKHIDGGVSSLMALKGLMLTPEGKKSVPVFFLGGGSGAAKQPH